MTYTTNPKLNERLSFARSRAEKDGKVRFVTAYETSLHMPEKRNFFAMGPKDYSVVVDGVWKRKTYKGEL